MLSVLIEQADNSRVGPAREAQKTHKKEVIFLYKKFWKKNSQIRYQEFYSEVFSWQLF